VSADEQTVRIEARAWFEANWDPDLALGDWWERLASSGWGFPVFPSEWFGKGVSSGSALAVTDERKRAAAAAPPDRIGAKAIAPLLLEYGTDDQLRRYLPDTLTDRAVWCELFSEPGAGSDLAGLSTRAQQAGDRWIVTGQKVWSSGADFARWGLLLARTDPDLPKQRGLTCFVLDMDRSGVDVRPLVTMTGEAEFNEVFITETAVPNDNVVGDVGNGWTVVKSALAHERRAMGSGGLGDNSRKPDLAQRAGDVAERERAGRRRGGLASGGGAEELMRTLLARDGCNNARVRQDAARLYSLLRIARWTAVRPGAEPGVQRLITSEIARLQRDFYLRLEGPDAMLAGDDAPLGGVVQRLALWSPAMSIMLGTDEVQRNIVGERVLGLPGEPSVDRDVPWREIRKS
jgi:alkylation response protein AidB-like acyl-CoA dehydrogenase